MPGDPFDIELPTNTPLRRTAASAVRPLLRRALRLDVLSALYHELSESGHLVGNERRDSNRFAASALSLLGVTQSIETLDAIPSRGPLIVAANHPHGAFDGLVLLDAIGKVRPDVRLIANHWLACIPELRDVCFFVDPFERRNSAHQSLPGLRAAHLWLRNGGALIIFPAGEVAHVRRGDGTAVDSSWKTTVGRLAQHTHARVLPVHIGGANSRLFCAAGRIHPLLRTFLLPRELLKQRGLHVPLQLGRVLSPSALTTHGDSAAAVTECIRQAVEQARSQPPVASSVKGTRQEIAPSVDSADLASDVAHLPASAALLSAGPFDVYCASAAELPHVLQEIGRLRELSFRAVGEGTGAATDLDRFDDHYLHLFVWNRQTHEVVGAYRIGRTDLIVASRGVHGLYTRTLFRYDAALLRARPPALELGRSFVRPEYQRDHNALLLLWRGICEFVGRHPQYRLLFGAVSISARYSDRTREMLRQFLEQNHLHHDLAPLVAPEHSTGTARPDAMPSAPRTIADAEALAARFEPDGRGMPVLLRQYLKLNARALGFNVDPAFGDVLDALMMVDLLDVDARILRRYFGPASARTFLEHHRQASHAA